MTKPISGSVLAAGLAARLGPSVVARKVGLTEGAVRSHATGAATPRTGARKRYRESFDIPIESWDLSATTPPAAQAPRGRAGATSPGPEALDATSSPVDARQEVIELLRVARAQLEAAGADPDVPYSARSQLITSATGLCRLLARLSGQLEVTEVAIVRSAPWARLMRLVREVLAKHPAASADLFAAFERFENGGEEP